MSFCLEDEGGGKGLAVMRQECSFLLSDENVLELTWWWLHIPVNTPETIQLYTLNRWIVCYVDYFSIKLFFKKHTSTYYRNLSIGWVLARLICNEFKTKS